MVVHSSIMNAPPQTLSAVTPGLWVSSQPVRILGMPLTATMAIVALPRERLLLYSPIQMTPERRADVDALGTVAHLYAPNTYHHAWMGEWASAYPRAVVHAPRALRAKRPDLRIDREHDVGADGDLAEDFDEVHVDGFALEETVLVHRVSGTLLVADLVHNIGRPRELWTTTYAGAMGFYNRVAISRAIRWMGFRDRAAARASVDRIAACHFERLIVGHGNPILSDARASLLEAYAWLTPRATSLARVLPAPRRGFCG
jgi:hypothetical protein